MTVSNDLKDNTKNGKTDWVGFSSDLAVDVAADASASAIGAVAGSFFLPPVGTVVGAGVGMAVGALFNTKFHGEPPKSLVDLAKDGLKSGIKNIGDRVKLFFRG